MGRQFGLALTPNDLPSFVTTLLSASDTAISENITCRHASDVEFVENLSGASYFNFAFPSKISRQIKISHHGLEKYRLDISKSSAISVWISSIDGNKLYPGRLYYETSYYENGETHWKDAGFVEWAERLFARAKRSLVRYAATDLYAGPEALALLSGGQVTLGR